MSQCGPIQLSETHNMDSTGELGKGNSEKCVFSLKVPSVCDAVTLDGELFQAVHIVSHRIAVQGQAALWSL